MVYQRILLFFILLFYTASSLYPQPQGKVDGFTVGGALRYNLMSTNYESNGNKLKTKTDWDTWRLNVDGSHSGIDLSFEYRFYPASGTHFIHHGYLGYGFSEKVYMMLGVSQVPFGIADFASHSWWFQIPYYLGLEDDYDMGVRFDIAAADNLDLSLAYYRQAEPAGPVSGGNNVGQGRYSYDILPGSGTIVDQQGVMQDAYATLHEVDQFNARLNWEFISGWVAGLSAQAGGLFNAELDETTTSTAYAGHLTGTFGRFSLKTELISYDYNALSDEGEKLDAVQMGAYGYDYAGGENYSGGVAARANVYVAGLAYTLPVSWGPVSSIQAHIDYSVVDKTEESFHNTHHLVPGILVTAGSVYTYVDYAMGKNQPWLTDDFGKGLGSGVEDPDWNSRLNINVGYYF